VKSPTEYLERIAFAVDQGGLAEAEAEVRRALDDPAVIGVLSRAVGAAQGTVTYLRGDLQQARDYANTSAEDALRALRSKDAADYSDDAFIALAATYVGQRAGDASIGQKTREVLNEIPDALTHPKSEELAELVN